MEHIKRAVAKAKEEQGALPGVSPDSRCDERQGTCHDIRSTTYSQTRVFQPDADLLERHRIVAVRKSNRDSIHFDFLRTQMLSKMEEHGWRTVAVVSPTPNSGKTTVAINLAYSIAHDSKRTVILVDFDLRRPRIADYLGIPTDCTLNEVLAGQATIPEALVNPSLPGLVILPTGTRVSKSSEMLGSQLVAGLIDEVRERYPERIVMFDLPPLLVTDDAISVLPKMDCVLMVVGNGMVTKGEIEDSLRLLHGRSLLGVVMNMGDVQVRDDYYY